MGQMIKRIEKLEKTAGVGAAAPFSFILLDEFDPLPEGFDENDPNVLVVRLVGGVNNGKA